MNKAISALTIFILSCVISYAGPFKAPGKDTTISVKLEKNKPDQTVSCSFNDSTLAFSLKIGSQSVTGAFWDAFDFEIEALEIDKNDNYYLLMLEGRGPDDDNDCYFYEYIDGKIITCGDIPYTTGIKTNGDKTLKSESWMGFWVLTEDYYFDSNLRTLTKRPKDTYELNAEAKVTAKFSLLKERDDKSSSSGPLKPGAKITLIKADISPKCKDSDGNDESWLCYWYYIRTSDGTEGWCRMRDFREKVDGLPWAG